MTELASLIATTSCELSTGLRLLGLWMWSTTSPTLVRPLCVPAAPAVAVPPTENGSAFTSTMRNVDCSSNCLPATSRMSGSMGRTKTVFCAFSVSDEGGSMGDGMYA